MQVSHMRERERATSKYTQVKVKVKNKRYGPHKIISWPYQTFWLDNALCTFIKLEEGLSYECLRFCFSEVIRDKFVSRKKDTSMVHRE